VPKSHETGNFDTHIFCFAQTKHRVKTDKRTVVRQSQDKTYMCRDLADT